ncbi:hypothetical protein EDB80DRAFT_368394 [Ilyonectria destructans]|nr:hypothetical protein EDB80DRAFT_368394 [Ilyonectria destructans]
MSSDTFSPTVSPPSPASSTSTLRDLELEFQTLRDESLSYEDDVEFRIFINVLDLVDAVVVERSPLRGMRRGSFGRLFGGFRKRSEKTFEPIIISHSVVCAEPSTYRQAWAKDIRGIVREANGENLSLS